MPGDSLLNAYNRKRATFEGAGRTDLVKKLDKAIAKREAELDKASAPLADLTKAELLDRAGDLEGKSSMTKAELVEALEGSD